MSVQLPSGYTRYKYIESTGMQYIDTGFVPNQDTRIDIRTMPLSVADGGFIPYGAATGYNSNAFECYTTGGQYEFNYDGQYDFVGTAATGHLLSITHNKNNVTVTNETNGSEWTLALAYKEFTAPQKLVLCAINRGSITCGSLRMYSCKIYDNGTLIRDYVPCENASGVIGMYDVVNGVFYANVGTGTFTGKPVYTGIRGHITRLQQAKTDIASAITNKGTTVPSGAMMDDFAALIKAIKSGTAGNVYQTTVTPSSSTNSLTISWPSGKLPTQLIIYHANSSVSPTVVSVSEVMFDKKMKGSWYAFGCINGGGSTRRAFDERSSITVFISGSNLKVKMSSESNFSPHQYKVIGVLA